MSTSKIVRQLKDLASSRLDLLGDTELDRFSLQLAKLGEKITRTEKMAAIAALEAEIPFPQRDFFAVRMKKIGLKKPRKTASPVQFDEYIKNFKVAADGFKKRARELEKILERLRKTSDEKALEELEGMDAAGLDDLSRRANVLKPGAKLFRVPKSRKGRLDWLQSLRKSEFENWF